MSAKKTGRNSKKNECRKGKIAHLEERMRKEIKNKTKKKESDIKKIR